MPTWIRIRIPNPDPLTRLNPDPIRIRNPAFRDKGLTEDGIECLSPSAAQASRLLKSGVTLTGIYSQMVSPKYRDLSGTKIFGGWGIRDILMRIRICGSVPLTNRSVSNSGSNSSLTLRMPKTCFFSSYFFSTYGTHRHIIFSLKNFIFCKNLCYGFILQALFQSTQHLHEKRKGSGSVPLT